MGEEVFSEPRATGDVRREEHERLRTRPQDREARGLREFQVEEVAKVFGVPAPLVGVQVTEWGAGIEQLSKLFWRTGERLHIERFLAPFQNILLRPGDRFHVNTIDFLRGDSAAIKEMIMALQGDAQRAPVATREELRDIAGLTVDPVGQFMDRRLRRSILLLTSCLRTVRFEVDAFVRSSCRAARDHGHGA